MCGVTIWAQSLGPSEWGSPTDARLASATSLSRRQAPGAEPGAWGEAGGGWWQAWLSAAGMACRWSLTATVTLT